LGLITVFFPYKDEYLRAIVDENRVEFFMNLGAKRVIPDKSEETLNPMEEEEKPLPHSEESGDFGWGRPGTLAFAISGLKVLDTFEEIRDWAFKITEKKIRKKPHDDIEIYKKNAKKLLKEYYNGKSR